MRNFVIIGLGQFGKSMLESLVRRRFEVLVIDCDEAKIQWARDLATKAVKADVLNAGLLEELIPDGVNCAIVDLGQFLERSILVTNYLHKMGLSDIVVEAATPEHAEILRIVGATRIVFPELEAAERLAGLLAGRGALDFFPVSEGFSVVEILTPKDWVGKNLEKLALRNAKRVNVIAHRKRSTTDEHQHWTLPDPKRPFESDDLLLVAGNTESLDRIPSRR